MRRQLSTGAVIAAITLAVGGLTPSAQAPTFDFDTGNAGIEVIIPAVIPALFQTTTPNDAPIILRHTTVITNAWFDAIAPYHPTAVGVYSRLGRRPPAEAATNRQKNSRCSMPRFGAEQHVAPLCSQLAGNACVGGTRARQRERGPRNSRRYRKRGWKTRCRATGTRRDEPTRRRRWSAITTDGRMTITRVTNR